MTEEVQIIKPQEGYQTKFLTCPADIVIGGSGAGVGKSFALLMDAGRGVVKYENYGATIFRQSYQEIIMTGGLWDESKNIYSKMGGLPVSSRHYWNFNETESQVAFRYLSHEDQLKDWGGSQIPYIGWDELTLFSKRMFIYMLNRNRIGSMKPVNSSTPMMRPKMRATCNPDPDSWLAEFLEWWIDQETGFPIKERSGAIRFMIVDQDQFVWGNSREEVKEKAPHVFEDPRLAGIPLRDLIKSVAFIPGNIFENKELLKKNPGYLANLMAQSEEEQMRLLHGNWKIRTDGLSLFDWVALEDMFSNEVADRPSDKHWITIDHAGGGTKYQGKITASSGRDLCVMITWRGWKIIRIDIWTETAELNTNVILSKVQELRYRYRPLPVSQIIVDQDGTGVKDALRCHLFQGGAAQNEEKHVVDIALGEKKIRKAVMYEHRKTQCAYRTAEKINGRELSIDLNNVYVNGDPNPVRNGLIKVKGKTYEIRKLIKENLRVVRRENPDAIGRKKITNKEKMKNALGGLSPDIYAAIIMRAQFDYEKQPQYMTS